MSRPHTDTACCYYRRFCDNIKRMRNRKPLLPHYAIFFLSLQLTFECLHTLFECGGGTFFTLFQRREKVSQLTRNAEMQKFTSIIECIKNFCSVVFF